MANLYDYEGSIRGYEERAGWNTNPIDIHPWIDQDITPADVAAIVDGGCASGAYMPAVTYHQARETMNEHGCAVLDYIADTVGSPFHLLAKSLDSRFSNRSWDGLAVFFVSTAVEAWASAVEDCVSELLDAVEEKVQKTLKSLHEPGS